MAPVRVEEPEPARFSVRHAGASHPPGTLRAWFRSPSSRVERRNVMASSRWTPGHLRRRTRARRTRERLRARRPGPAARPIDPTTPLRPGPGRRSAGLAGGRGRRAGRAPGGRRTAAPPRAPTSPGSRGPEVGRRPRDEVYPSQVVTSYLVHALFRQLVTTGSVGDPLTDALDALSLHPNRAGLVRHVGRPGSSGQSRTRGRVDQPDRAPARAHSPLRTGLAAPHRRPRGHSPGRGTCRPLRGVRPAGGRAGTRARPRCAPSNSPRGGRGPSPALRLHYLALLETLRHGNPPFRLGLLDSAVGRYVIEDVRQEHLRAMASHLVTRLGLLAGADD